MSASLSAEHFFFIDAPARRCAVRIEGARAAPRRFTPPLPAVLGVAGLAAGEAFALTLEAPSVVAAFLGGPCAGAAALVFTASRAASSITVG